MNDASKYRVVIADNFHYGDSDEFSTDSKHATAEEAVARCRQIVEASLAHEHKPGMTPDELVAAYKDFGSDPFVEPRPPVDFSAWQYAEAMAASVCASRSPIVAERSASSTT